MFQGNEVRTITSTNWRGYRVAAWVGEFLLAIATVFILVRVGWQEATILLGFLIASVVFLIRDLRLPTLFDLLFVIAALLNAGGWIGLFYQPGPYDEITHAFTTFSITLALSFLVYQSMLTVFRSHRLLYILTIISFGIAIGALWEVFEWVTKTINDLDDTIVDLIMDTIGATAASFLSLRALQEQTRPQRN
ncbi:MAG: hypothetical protein SAL07_13490 [Oscillatoria sp. PMC 1051.18]|nr:hypothetical protein [Oscillatoria sp. PMC 1050.18]MEC5030906.1 hypothetical protein [Oscillatoria sp. PMC 1051.18]